MDSERRSAGAAASVETEDEGPANGIVTRASDPAAQEGPVANPQSRVKREGTGGWRRPSRTPRPILLGLNNPAMAHGSISSRVGRTKKDANVSEGDHEGSPRYARVSLVVKSSLDDPDLDGRPGSPPTATDA